MFIQSAYRTSECWRSSEVNIYVFLYLVWSGKMVMNDELKGFEINRSWPISRWYPPQRRSCNPWFSLRRGETLVCLPDLLILSLPESSHWFPASASGSKQFGSNHRIRSSIPSCYSSTPPAPSCIPSNHWCNLVPFHPEPILRLIATYSSRFTVFFISCLVLKNVISSYADCSGGRRSRIGSLNLSRDFDMSAFFCGVLWPRTQRVLPLEVLIINIQGVSRL
jgi:hypothetical protein